MPTPEPIRRATKKGEVCKASSSADSNASPRRGKGHKSQAESPHESVEIERCDPILIVRLPPYRNAKQLAPYIDLAFKECTTHRLNRLLVDASANARALTPIEYLKVADYVEAQATSRELRIAAVLRQSIMPDARFLQHMLYARGIRYRIFSNIEEARQWLTRDRP